MGFVRFAESVWYKQEQSCSSNRRDRFAFWLLSSSFETRLYKAIVVAIPFRMRAIPIYFKVYSNEQIQDMVYMSHNTLIVKRARTFGLYWDFLNKLKKLQHQALGKRRRFVWIFDRGFADVKLMIKLKKWKVGFIIRVCRNVGKLGQYQAPGYLENIVYHKDKRIRVNLYCVWDENYDDPDRRFVNSDTHMLLVSNQACNLLQLYSQRMKIEEDLKSLFGFRSLVLKDNSQCDVKWKRARFYRPFGFVIPALRKVRLSLGKAEK